MLCQIITLEWFPKDHVTLLQIQLYHYSAALVSLSYFFINIKKITDPNFWQKSF